MTAPNEGEKMSNAIRCWNWDFLRAVYVVHLINRDEPVEVSSEYLGSLWPFYDLQKHGVTKNGILCSVAELKCFQDRRALAAID